MVLVSGDHLFYEFYILDLSSPLKLSIKIFLYTFLENLVYNYGPVYEIIFSTLNRLDDI